MRIRSIPTNRRTRGHKKLAHPTRLVYAPSLLWTVETTIGIRHPPRLDIFDVRASNEGLRLWYLYLIECESGAFYAGITNDLAARYAAHVSGLGAKYTRGNPPRRLLGSREYPDRASASRAEWEIKRLPKSRKLAYLLN